jgi:hypothetical protein
VVIEVIRRKGQILLKKFKNMLLVMRKDAATPLKPSASYIVRDIRRVI